MSKSDIKKPGTLKHVGTPLLLSTGVMLAADVPLTTEAAIIYNNNIASLNTINTNTLLNGVNVQFLLSKTYVQTSTFGGVYNYKARVNMKSVFTDGGAGYAKNFSAGALIGGTTGLSAWNQTQTLFTFSGQYANFNPVKTNLNFNGTTASTGYIGFYSGGNYGWAKVEVLGGGNYRLNGWAYEDSGASILAGDQGGGGGSSVPEPTGLALLACGAAGIYALRKKCKKTEE